MLRFIIILLLCTFQLNAQNTYTGIVVDANSLKAISGASLVCENKNYHAISDSKGQFSIEISEVDSLRFIVRHLSYHPHSFYLKKIDGEIKIELKPLVVDLEYVDVSALAAKKRKLSTGTILIGVDEIESLPTQLGEIDVLKVLELQAGVIRTSELSSGINVRGGSGGHNSFLLDGQAIFNPNHLLGFMSTFNSDLLSQVKMDKDTYHPRLGGSLSSYIQVKNRIGSKDSIKAKLGIGLLSSRLMLEGPIKKSKSSFILGVRRSYFDLFTKNYNNIHEDKKEFSPLPEYNFSDIQFKIHTQITESSFLELNAFKSYDDLDLLSDNSKSLGTTWGNQFLNLHLRKYISSRSQLSVNSGISHYAFDLEQNHHLRLQMQSSVLRWNNSVDWSFKLNSKLNIDAGAFFDYSWYKNDNREVEEDLVLNQYKERLKSSYSGVYVWSDIVLFHGLELGVGCRLNVFGTDRVMVKASPRLQLKFIRKTWAMNLSYSKTHQFNHLISAYGINLPNDLWYPSSEKVPSEMADQLALGFDFRQIKHLKFRTSLYYKQMKNQLDYADGADLLFNDISEQILLSDGDAKGMEIETQYGKGRFTGNMNYTLADTWRKNDLINQGERFHPSFDITHKLNLSFQYKLSPSLSFSAAWFYASGQSITFPAGAVLLQGFGNERITPRVVPLYADRFNVRMSPTHRLDIGLKYVKTHRKGKSIYSFGVYNLYNRANPYFYYFDTEKTVDNTIRILPKQKSLIPFLPSLNYTYEF